MTDERLDAATAHMEAAARALREGRVDALIAETQRARELVPPEDAERRFRLGSLLQAAFRFSGRPDVQADACIVLAEVSDRLERPDLAVPARALLGSVSLLAGDFHAALDRCDAALDLARATGTDAARASALAWQFRGYVLYEWNRLDEAEDALTRAWTTAGPDAPGVRSGVARMRARLHAVRGEREDADRWLQELEAIVAEPMTLRNREWLAATRVQLALGTGALQGVDEWLRTYDYRAAELEAMATPELTARLHEIEQAVAVLEASGRWEALARTACQLERAAGHTRRWYRTRALGARAVAEEALGRSGAADRLWTEALAAGEEGGFVRVHLDGDPALRSRLLERAATRPATAGWAQRVRSAASPADSDAPLSARQLEVLRRAAAGDSNKAIARALDVSLSTVKTHLRAVFGRLGVTSRTRAVAVARARGWL